VRPIRLQLKSFTAFRDEQVVEFDDLDLFAISGPTGSGKSSILDAITYALFGYVERVGKQVSQLVSQGQPGMAVTFEFAVDDRHYRVTRRTLSARGQTKILLERQEGGEWQQAGDGADRVREAEAMIRDAIGLDYEAFTRSVLLPQGAFAEFLVGEAKERRGILTELLGLELFERLAKRAGELKREAQIVAESDERLLRTEYEGVTPEALEAARTAAAAAERTRDALAAAEAEVRAIAERWRDAERAVEDLHICATDARGVAMDASSVGEVLAGVGERATLAEGRMEATATASKAAVKRLDRATAALAKAEADGGPATALAALGERARLAAGLRQRSADVRDDLGQVRRELPDAEEGVVAAAEALALATADVEAALGALEQAREKVRETEHADHLAAVVAGLHAGDACPVCGTTLTALPKAPGAKVLERAAAAAGKAEAAASAANAALERAKAEHERGVRGRDESLRASAALEKELAALEGELAKIDGGLAEALGGALPPDPLAAIQERLAALETLAEEVGAAEAAERRAKDDIVQAERERDVIAAEADTARARLDGLPLAGVRQRARALAGDDIEVPAAPVISRAKDAPAVGALAEEIATAFGRLAQDLDAVAERRADAEVGLLEEALEVVGDRVPSAGSLAALVRDVESAHRAAGIDAATASKEAETLEGRLGKAGRLLEEVAAQGRRAERFRALALELHADRITAFLQMEALQMLASAGSERLAALSSGRYQLEYVKDDVKDEFLVVDTWNGEERRSARTLSGGETFLASLALALALSEQVRALSVTEKARLDSLFLDEGFGTLDPESLEVVVDAIEQLGGDGRMVGVITHVQELAIRMPARIEIEKSPRGSRLQIVS
jgi:exonuclease SbcC